MRKTFLALLGAVSITGLAACAVPPDDYRAFPDDYRATGDYRGDPDTFHRDSRDSDAYYVAREREAARDRSYRDRDGDGVLNWRDRYPDDPRRF